MLRSWNEIFRQKFREKVSTSWKRSVTATQTRSGLLYTRCGEFSSKFCRDIRDWRVLERQNFGEKGYPPYRWRVGEESTTMVCCENFQNFWKWNKKYFVIFLEIHQKFLDNHTLFCLHSRHYNKYIRNKIFLSVLFCSRAAEIELCYLGIFLLRLCGTKNHLLQKEGRTMQQIMWKHNVDPVKSIVFHFQSCEMELVHFNIKWGHCTIWWFRLFTVIRNHTVSYRESSENSQKTRNSRFVQSRQW